MRQQEADVSFSKFISSEFCFRRSRSSEDDKV